MRAKVFGEGWADPADRNEKCRIIARAHGYNARHRADRQHDGPLTKTTLSVLTTLLWVFHNHASGRCFPAHQRIADEADCCRDSVIEAMKALELAGLLTWQHRLVRGWKRRRDLFGERWVYGVLRTSNAYILRSAKWLCHFPTRTIERKILPYGQRLTDPRQEAMSIEPARPTPRLQSGLEAALASFAATAGFAFPS